MANVLGAVWGGTVHELYGYLSWLSLQLFAKTAERGFLLIIGALYGLFPTAAAFASGDVTATGTDGTSILAGTILRLNAATSYRVTVGQVIAGGTATLPVVAVLAGEAGNQVATTGLSFESPIAGVFSLATVAVGGLTGGADEEGTEDFRTRVLERKRKPPEGGADQDYIAWAKLVSGVTRVWVYRQELGKGTVVVRFVRDLDPDIFPDPGEVAAVQAVIASKRPTTAEPTAAAPTALTIDFTLSITPDNADTRTAVEAELADVLRRFAAPGNATGTLGKILLSKIRTAIDTSEGVTDYVLTVPPADVVPGVGELPVMGTVTWV